jgi:succinate dehydrogenase hydrophobic anchor subunit
MALSFIQNIGGGSLIIILFLFFFCLAYFILWLFCLIDVIRSEFKNQSMKIIWIIILLFAHIVGPLVYLVLRKSSKNAS